MAQHQLSCPFCHFQDADEYILMLHIEELHTDDSPFVAKSSTAIAYANGHGGQSHLQEPPSRQVDRDDSSEQYVACPESDCGEDVLLSDLNEHLDLHFAERVTLEEEQNYSSSSSHRHSSSILSSSDMLTRKMRTLSSLPEDASSPAFIEKHFSTNVSPYLRHTVYDSSGSSTDYVETPSKPSTDKEKGRSRRRKRPRDPIRQGTSELGPYAFEEKMPPELWKKLLDGPKVTKTRKIARNGTLITQEVVENETAGLIPVIAQLSSNDRDVREAYLCNPAVAHIFAPNKEGGFCGYRNIQMLASYLQGTKAEGFDKFPGRVPTIPKLQDMIEHAWDSGIFPQGRVETGGIRGTRKYIGTPEARSLFESLSIPIGVDAFFSSEDGPKAYEQLFDWVEAYFKNGTLEHEDEAKTKIHKTVLSPIYLQQPGHSVTVIGIERRRDGSRNLLVFDPMYKTTPALVQLLGRPNISSPHTQAMESVRRYPANMQRHKSFEALVLTSDPPRFPAWDVLSKFRHTPFIYAFFDLDHENYEVYPADAFDRLFPWFYYAGLFSVREGRFARVGGDASFRRLGVPALCVGFDWDKWKRSKDIAPLVLPFATTRRNIGSMSPSTDIDGASDDWQTLSPSSPLAHNLFSTMTGTCSCDNCLLDLMRQNVQRMRELRDDIQASFLSSPASSSSPNSLSYIQPLSPFDPIPVSPALCSYPECQPLGPGTPDYPAYYGPPSLGYATVQGYPDPPCSQYWQHENAAPVGPPSVSAWSSPYPCPPGFLSVFYSPHRIDFMENDIICPSTPTPISLPSLTTDMSSPIGPPTPRTPRLSVDSGTTLVTPYSPMDWSSNNNNSEEKWDRFAPETYVPGGLAAFAGNAQWASMDSIVPRG